MEALVGLLKDVLTSQPVLQVFAGAIALIVIAYMVLRGQGDRAHAVGPTPAPAPLNDVPAIFAQGPRETVDLLRELRDLARRAVEDIGAIRECTRIIRTESERQTETLERIEREQAIANRAVARDRDRT